MPSSDLSSGIRDALDVLRRHDPESWNQAIDNSGLAEATHVEGETRRSVVELLQGLACDLAIVQRPIRQRLQKVLDALAGKKFDSLETKQAITRGLQELLNRLGLRVICPKKGCGRPASLRCAAAGNSKEGVFQFDHPGSRPRTTHLGASAFPKLELIEAPPDGRRLPASS